MSLANPGRTSLGVQCRTMLSQRPCGNPQCTREECSGARKSAEVFASQEDSQCLGPYLDCMNGICDHGTNDSTENGSEGAQSAPQGEDVSEPQYALTGLSEGEARTLYYLIANAGTADPHIRSLWRKVAPLRTW